MLREHPPLVRRAELLRRGSAGLEDTVAWAVHVGDEPLTNAANLVEWGADPVQLVVCSECGHPGCAQGNYVTIRSVGPGLLLVAPAFEAAAGALGLQQYGPPALLERQGWLLDLARVAAALPELEAAAAGLRPPTAAELARLAQWEAPDRALGAPDRDPALGGDVLDVAADGEPAARVVEVARALLREADRAVALRPAGAGDVPITLFLDGGASGSAWQEWSPLAATRAGLRLRLEPGWIVDPT